MFTIKSFKILSQTVDATFQLSQLEQKIFDLLNSFCDSLEQQVAPRVAGGWVRDKILGISSKDIDITIDSMKGVDFAEQLKQFVLNRFGSSQKIIGTIKDTEARPEQIKNLSVAFLKIYEQEVEILNLRGNEVYEEGNRNPISTTAASPEQDAFRRDLTINSLFYNIRTRQIEDFTGKGYDDLLTMTLRTPLDPIKTFIDDPLRLLRILRFHSRYKNSTITPEIVESMKNENVQYQIVRKITDPNDSKGIVVERTSEELRKIMQGVQPEKAIAIMYETGLLAKVLNLPQTHQPLNMNQLNPHHELDVISHTIEVLKNVNQLAIKFGIDDEMRMLLNFSALFHDLGKLDPRSHVDKPDGTRGYHGNPTVELSLAHEDSSAELWKQFSKSLQLSNHEREIGFDLVTSHMNPHGHINNSSDSAMRRYIRKNPLWFYHYIHAMADSLSKTKNPDISVLKPYEDNLQKLKSLSLNLTNDMKKQNDLLNGQEIMGVVGLPASPPKGEKGYIEVVKEIIREQQDNDPNFSKEQAIELVKNLVQNNFFNKWNTNNLK